jgi:gamma-glutamylcyclotransferase (GGCT)/AIG2-like uncharacterized protein YtfP
MDDLPPGDSQPSRVFVYGTLQVPHVLKRVLGRAPTMVAATLDGYRRGRVVGKSYPAVVAEPLAQVDGAVLCDVSSGDWPLLDAYEGELYTRTMVTVTLDDFRKCGAACYVLRAGCEQLFDPTPWSLEHFLERDLATFLRDWD